MVYNDSMSDPKPIAFFEKCCCDPFKTHKKITKDLQIVGSNELASSVVKLYHAKPVPISTTHYISTE